MVTMSSQETQQEAPQYPKWQQIHREAQLKHQVEVDLKEQLLEAETVADRLAKIEAETKRREDVFKTAMSLFKLPIPESGISLEVDGYLFSLGYCPKPEEIVYKDSLSKSIRFRFSSFGINITVPIPADISEMDLWGRRWPVRQIAVFDHEKGKDVEQHTLCAIADALDWVRETAEDMAREIRLGL